MTVNVDDIVIIDHTTPDGDTIQTAALCVETDSHEARLIYSCRGVWERHVPTDALLLEAWPADNLPTSRQRVRDMRNRLIENAVNHQAKLKGTDPHRHTLIGIILTLESGL